MAPSAGWRDQQEVTVTQGPRRDSFPLAGKGSFGPHQSGDLETPRVGTSGDQETSRLIIPTHFHVERQLEHRQCKFGRDLTHRCRVTRSLTHLHDQVELNRALIRILLRNGAPTHSHVAVYCVVKSGMIHWSCGLLRREKKRCSTIAECDSTTREIVPYCAPLPTMQHTVNLAPASPIVDILASHLLLHQSAAWELS